MFPCLKLVNTAPRNSIKIKHCKERLEENVDEYVYLLKYFTKLIWVNLTC